MVEYLLRCGLTPNQPRPSIETLLHAFIPALHVDHTHPDAIIALTSSPEGRSLAEEAFGSEAVWLDYQRPGFGMSKRIAELLEENPSARAVLLEKHGLVTWGETPEQSYRATIEFVTETELFAMAPGARRRRRQELTSDVNALIKDLSELKVGDPVVHVNHGIGRYLGLTTIALGGDEAEAGEFLQLEYADKATLYVPVAQLHLIARYTGVSAEEAPLHKLGSGQWDKARRKAARFRRVCITPLNCRRTSTGGSAGERAASIKRRNLESAAPRVAA